MTVSLEGVRTRVTFITGHSGNCGNVAVANLLVVNRTSSDNLNIIIPIIVVGKIHQIVHGGFSGLLRVRSHVLANDAVRRMMRERAAFLRLINIGLRFTGQFDLLAGVVDPAAVVRTWDQERGE
ncbi:hypothetical protein KCU88_g235, partial [Aureobasidium melanogenum]